MIEQELDMDAITEALQSDRLGGQQDDPELKRFEQQMKDGDISADEFKQQMEQHMEQK